MLGRHGWYGTASVIILSGLIAGVCIFASAPLAAQTISGVIAVHVKDIQGKPLGAVSIEVKNPNTGRSYAASTDTEGNYRFPEIPPGDYEVTIANEGFQSVKHTPVHVTVNRVTNEEFTMKLAPEAVTIEVRASTSALTDNTGPTIAMSFPEQEVHELPILTRDANNLGLLAPGVLSVRTFAFGSTLVPFSSNGSRGRDNNFIIDSVDNNEPLFGGAATQFTNTDIVAEYTILTGQLKAEFGRNSGATVNMITKSGSNHMGGTLFWFGQHDAFNARSRVEQDALLNTPARYYENQIGATLGGPIVKDKTFYFISYQWDRTRNNLTNIFPVVATYPTPAGLAALRGLPQSNALLALTGVPSVSTIPQLTSAPCFGAPVPAGFNATNPCRTPTNVFVGTTAIPFSTYLVPNGNAYDVRDHQWSARVDHKLSNASDLYGRYLFDELHTPRFPLSNAGESAFSDLGLYPDYKLLVRQRSQSLLVDHRYYWPRALNEFRFSFSRIASNTGAFHIPENIRNTQASATVQDAFGGFGVFQPLFPSAGVRFTIGRDSSTSRITSNIFQFQENFSFNRGTHSMKFGVNIVRTQSDISSNPSDLGQYFFGAVPVNIFPGLAPFATEPGATGVTHAAVVLQRLPNLVSDPNTGAVTGQGTPQLRLREFDHFYFWQDDWRVSSGFTLSYGVRYENFGQPINGMAEQNRRVPRVNHDNNNLAPRIGFAWSPWGTTVIRGGYALMFNPMVQNIPLLVWQSAPVSPFYVSGNSSVFIACTNPLGCPPGTFGPATLLQPQSGRTYPSQPFRFSDVNVSVAGCSSVNQRRTAGAIPLINCSPQDAVVTSLVNPYAHNFSLGVQQGLGNNLLFEIGYVGSRGTKLFLRRDVNPYTGWNLPLATNCFFLTQFNLTLAQAGGLCLNNRVDNTHGSISRLGNDGTSSYHSLQASLSRRMSTLGSMGNLAFTLAYTWSHNIDLASEIFGPGIRSVPTGIIQQFLSEQGGEFGTIEAISPFAQNPNNLHSERANSSFDRRHRFVSSYLWEIGHSHNVLVGGWQLGGIVTWQTGQFFTPLNGSFIPINFSSGACADPFGTGKLTTARPAIGNPSAPLTSVAVLVDPNCAITPSVAFPFGYKDLNGNSIDPTTAHFVQEPVGSTIGQPIAGFPKIIAGSAGRNTILGPGIVNWDLSLLKNFRIGESRKLQFRWEIYDVLNHANPGNPIGNVFTTDAQFSPAFAFSPRFTPAGVTGVIPENTIDAPSVFTTGGTFGTRRFMNFSSRRMQFALKLIF
ncbi:MAG TPA: TonB-dependent receptor [Candidatus Acidoferrales bacterium]|nr:TonB-dependent receptor [Candidatus Acidoferrales bacterium]